MHVPIATHLDGDGGAGVDTAALNLWKQGGEGGSLACELILADFITRRSPEQRAATSSRWRLGRSGGV